jgi:hypothetical protein
MKRCFSRSAGLLLIVTLVLCIPNIAVPGEKPGVKPIPKTLKGFWLGTLTPPGRELRIAFKFHQDQSSGELSGTMDSIDEKVKDLPLNDLKYNPADGKISVGILVINASFEGRYKEKAGGFVGIWKQGKFTLPVVLKPIKKIPEPGISKKTAIKMDPALYDQFAGDYQYKPGRMVHVTKENNRLFVQLTGNPKAEVFPESPNRFFVKVIDGDFTFVKGADGKVTAVIFRHGNRRMRANRVK